MENENERPYRRHHPDFFWPITLITVGVVWLLVNNGTIAQENIYRLFPLWPILLILAGVSLILQRLWWPLSGLLWGAAAVALVWALINPPTFLPASVAPETRQETFRAPLGNAKSASINLNLSGSPNRVYVLEDSTDLLVADLTFIGGMQFDVSGSGNERSVTLDENRGPRWGIVLLNDIVEGNRPWEIGLSGQVPLRLRIETNAGESTLDLAGLILESLNLNGGSGEIDLTLPQGGRRFLFDYDGGSGNLTVQVPQEATFEMGVDGGSGNIIVDVPDGAGVQVDVRDDGSGALRLPTGFERVSDNGSDDEDEGVWENEAYSTTQQPIQIVVHNQGSGDIEIR